MEGQQSKPAPIQRMPTGITGLDTVLHGGMLKGGSYILIGGPGTGKTVMSNQMAFYHAQHGERVVYITLLAETHSRMIGHLQSFTFFSPEPIAQTLYFISALAELEKSGLNGVLDLIRRTVIAHSATLLILDGLETVHLTSESEFVFKRFVKDLQVAADATGCTALYITGDDEASIPIQLLMDGVIRLNHKILRTRAIREITITKFRGSAYMEGSHSFTITQAGVVIYPRMEALANDYAVVAPEAQRYISIGVPELDTMLGGGLLAGSTTMALGASGSGKTALGLHFLAAGARIGEPGLCFGFYETPARLIGKADNMGLDFTGYTKRGLINVMWHAPTTQLLDALAERLLSAIDEYKIQRLFLDGIDGFRESSFYPERVGTFFTALMNELRLRNVCTIFTLQLDDLVGPTIAIPLSGVSSIAENIIFLRYVELNAQLYRLLSIIKVRENSYDPRIREFRITDRGIEIAATFDSAEDILSGLAQVKTNRTRPPTAADQEPGDADAT